MCQTMDQIGVATRQEEDNTLTATYTLWIYSTLQHTNIHYGSIVHYNILTDTHTLWIYSTLQHTNRHTYVMDL